MKKILLILSLIAFAFNPNVELIAQDHEIKIDANQSKDSTYIMLSESAPGKYRQGRGKWTNYEDWKGALMDSIRQEITDSIAASTGGASYLVYTALLTQSGTDAPVATVLENTLGVTPSWAYGGIAGYYTVSATGKFVFGKTTVIIGGGNLSSVTGSAFVYNLSTDDSPNDLTILTLDPLTLTAGNGFLRNTLIEIRAYP